MTLPTALLPILISTLAMGEAAELAPAVTPAPTVDDAAQPQSADVASFFPAATGGFEIAIGSPDEPYCYMDLVEEYGRLTGQFITFSSDTEGMLRNQQIHLDRTMAVAQADVQSVFEHLLIRGDFTLSIVRSGETQILEIASLATAARNNMRSRALFVQEKDIDRAEQHPAMLFTTTLNLPNLDVRQVSNSMRTMITDANTQQMLPAGNSNSMVLVGFGNQVAALARMLHQIDAASVVEKKEVSVSIVRLEKALAVDTANLINAVIGHANQTQPIQQGTPMGQPASVKILPDVRTNSLLISGTPERIKDITALVKALDV